MKISRVMVTGDGRPYWLPGGAGYEYTLIEIKGREYKVRDGWLFVGFIVAAFTVAFLFS